MTYRILRQLIEDNEIQYDVALISDSGWECGATDMDVVYYNESINTLIFTQEGNIGHTVYDNDPDWVLLYKKGDDIL